MLVSFVPLLVNFFITCTTPKVLSLQVSVLLPRTNKRTKAENAEVYSCNLPSFLGNGKLQRDVTSATKQRRSKVFEAISLFLGLQSYLCSSSWVNDVFCFHSLIYMRFV